MGAKITNDYDTDFNLTEETSPFCDLEYTSPFLGIRRNHHF